MKPNKLYIYAALFTTILYANMDPFSVSNSVKPLGACENLQLSKPLDLTDISNIALCNNPDTKYAWMNAVSKSSQVGIGKSAYLPTLDANGNLSSTKQSQNGNMSAYNQQNADLTLSYLLYDFGARSANLENAKQLLNSANNTQNYTVQTVLLSTISAYYKLFATKASYEAYMEAEKTALESYKAANTRYEAGVATPADKLQAKTSYSQAVLNRGRAEGEMKNAKGVLLNLLGLDADTNLEILPPAGSAPQDSFLKNVKELISSAKKNRSDLMAADSEIRAAEASVKAAEASGRPSISLNSTLGYADSSISSPAKTGTVGVYLSVPLFSGFSTTYKIKAAKEAVKLKEITYHKLEKQVALDVFQAYNNLNTDYESYKTSVDLVNSAEESLKVASGRYKAGVGTILDLLSAQSSLADARQQRISALYNWYISKAALAQALGTLEPSK